MMSLREIRDATAQNDGDVENPLRHELHLYAVATVVRVSMRELALIAQTDDQEAARPHN